MHMGTAQVTIDPTKPEPWYVNLGKQLLEANKVRQVQKINADRLSRGLEPLTEQEMRALTGAVTAKVELPQDVKTAMYIGGAAALAILFFALKKRR
jgi:hypothetical protein